ncbi:MULTISPECIES: MarR family winged helix-turn-helix transcriptional regulator [Glycomyces]|uniref:MarR family transcriptional regulator n=2 Tax=Glycomyces TaxID=58113 RepID=A0A9X3SWL2_9ACTN|nr:MarR family transcriptional regulator [Glycomyces lechevalierae]MDA1387975.1 MarR family transcriptional regulator [Glycomyces lechevalierae]MDR7339112.1 DNA-binding MarR family transcriptional regulator [Glycomyces lechevalierae]
MRRAEAFRYLVLAIQREGNRLLAAELRPLGLTPSQGEVVRVLADHAPLTLQGLGELLVCETGGSPSRLVDRLVAAGLVHREADPDDRRWITLTLTETGRDTAARVKEIEERLHDTIDELTAGGPLDETLDLLRQFANAFPSGQALARREARRHD